MARFVTTTRRTERPPRRDRLAWLLQPLPRGDANGRMILAVTTLLVTFGTIAVASASEGQSSANGASSWALLIHDAAYLVFGLAAFYVMARVRLVQLVRYARHFTFVALGLLVAVELVGVSANGGQRWLNLKLINLQPSELFKLCTVLYVAWLVQRHHNELGHARQLSLWTLPVLVGAGLIILEPDIGTSSVVLAIGYVMLAVAGLSRRLLTRIAGLGILVFGAYMIAKPYAASRFFSFLHPNLDPLGSGYQLTQSKIGLGAGGLTGLGLGHSREKWGLLPNPHTDFIFAIIGEELGYVGTLVVLGLFVWFLFAGLRVARTCTNPVYQLVAVGVTTWITLEAIINIFSVVGWWAVTGIPLPFFSYGGTALITELAAVGLLYNVAHDRSRAGDVTIREHHVSTYRDVVGGGLPRRDRHGYGHPRGR
ncbi:MAG: FtsW/RodA/SpoVE family cell cycle protein [Acidimicrobiales bacterium]